MDSNDTRIGLIVSDDNLDEIVINNICFNAAKNNKLTALGLGLG